MLSWQLNCSIFCFIFKMPFQDLRKELVARISKESDILPGNNQFYHGKLVSELLDPPKGKNYLVFLGKRIFYFSSNLGKYRETCGINGWFLLVKKQGSWLVDSNRVSRHWLLSWWKTWYSCETFKVLKVLVIANPMESATKICLGKLCSTVGVECQHQLESDKLPGVRCSQLRVSCISCCLPGTTKV